MGAVAALAMTLLPALCRAQSALPDKTPPGDQDTVVVDEKTDQVIHGALQYLAAKQLPDGSWTPDHKAALTAYCIMAFLAGGELPDEGEYGRNVSNAEKFLLQCIRPDGYIAAATGASNMYGHGMATIALSELFGQTKDPNLRPKLERAVKLIISCQNAAGGWRYNPRPADADISVTVLQVVALRAARNSGIEVPQETIDNAVKFVKSCSDESGGFTYQPHNHAPGFARTAAAIYTLQVCGLYDDPLIKPGSDFLFKTARTNRQWFTYGNFYAAPAQYMIGGEVWRRWYTDIHDKLMARVKVAAGGADFWLPIDGGQGVNDIYATAVYSTILSMPYHYIPLYQR
jgi:hypothetical protein